jgi:Flp pilus assembly protein TadG
MTWQQRSRGEQGAIAVEFMFVMSMLLVVFLLMLQYAVRAHAEHIASAAAREGLAAATAYDGSAAAGQQTAQRYLSRLGSGLHGSSVSADRDPDTAVVTVTGEAQQFIPFLTVDVRVRVEGPVERFVEQP